MDPQCLQQAVPLVGAIVGGRVFAAVGGGATVFFVVGSGVNVAPAVLVRVARTSASVGSWVSKSVSVGKSVKVGASVSVGKSVKVGASVSVGNNVKVGASVSVGQLVSVIITGTSSKLFIGAAVEVGVGLVFGDIMADAVPIQRHVITNPVIAIKILIRLFWRRKKSKDFFIFPSRELKRPVDDSIFVCGFATSGCLNNEAPHPWQNFELLPFG